MSLSFLKDIVSHMRPSGSPADSIPPRLFKEVFATIGPRILQIIHRSLSSGTVPGVLKHAFIRPLLKKNRPRPLSLLQFQAYL